MASTPRSTYRFDQPTLALIESLASAYSSETGLECNATDALRLAVREAARKRGLGSENKSEKKRDKSRIVS